MVASRETWKVDWRLINRKFFTAIPGKKSFKKTRNKSEYREELLGPACPKIRDGDCEDAREKILWSQVWSLRVAHNCQCRMARMRTACRSLKNMHIKYEWKYFGSLTKAME